MYLPDTMSCYRRHSAGIWATAYTDLQAHIAQWSYSLLRFNQVLSKHFQGKFQSILNDNVYSIYSSLTNYYVEREPSALDFYQDLFPEQAEIYKNPTTLGLNIKE